MDRHFRAWDKEKNRYVPPEIIGLLLLRPDGRVMLWGKTWERDVAEDFDIEFSLGYKAKDGVEIYEGDLLLDVYCCSPELCGYFLPDEKVIREAKIPEFYMFLGCGEVQNSPDGSVEKYVSFMQVVGNIHEVEKLPQEYRELLKG